jgi:hypothetical protein
MDQLRPEHDTNDPEILEALYRLARQLKELDHGLRLGLVLAHSFTTFSRTNP